MSLFPRSNESPDFVEALPVSKKSVALAWPSLTRIAERIHWVEAEILDELDNILARDGPDLNLKRHMGDPLVCQGTLQSGPFVTGRSRSAFCGGSCKLGAIGKQQVAPFRRQTSGRHRKHARFTVGDGAPPCEYNLRAVRFAASSSAATVALVEDAMMDRLADPQPLADGFASLHVWLAREFSSPSIIAQTAAIAVAAGVALLATPPLQRWIRTWHRRVDTKSRLGQSTNAFVRRLTLTLLPLLAPIVALLLLWPALLAAQRAGWPRQELKFAVSLLAAWILIRLISSLVRDRFWARAIAVVVWAIAALNIFGLLDDTATYLYNLSWTVGGLRVSPMAIITGIVWLCLLLWLASWLARVLEARVLSLSRATPSLQLLAARLLKVVLIIAAVFIALGTIGIDLTAFAVFTGALGVGIGFGLQAIFNNFVAGLILLSEKSLKVGDFIDLERGHLAGTVRQINIRNTIITTPDSIDVAVPNSEFVNGRVTNWTMLDANARIHVPSALPTAPTSSWCAGRCVRLPSR